MPVHLFVRFHQSLVELLGLHSYQTPLVAVDVDLLNCLQVLLLQIPHVVFLAELDPVPLKLIDQLCIDVADAQVELFLPPDNLSEELGNGIHPDEAAELMGLVAAGVAAVAVTHD